MEAFNKLDDQLYVVLRDSLENKYHALARRDGTFTLYPKY